MIELRLRTFLIGAPKHLNYSISQNAIHELVLNSRPLVMKKMEEGCYKLAWENKHLRFFFKEVVGSSIARGTRTMKITFMDALAYTAQFTVGYKKVTVNKLTSAKKFCSFLAESTAKTLIQESGGS